MNRGYTLYLAYNATGYVERIADVATHESTLIYIYIYIYIFFFKKKEGGKKNNNDDRFLLFLRTVFRAAYRFFGSFTDF